jgi:hypothetical protein
MAMFGTGDIVYGQLGYLMPDKMLGEGHGKLMPYVSVMSADFDRVSSMMNVWSAGINWLIDGHNSKLSLDYQNRPVYSVEGSTLKEESRKSQLVLQYQILF